MLSRHTTITLCLALAVPALSFGGDPRGEPLTPVQFGKTQVEAQFLQSAFGSGETWTVFADGRIQHAKRGGGPAGGAGVLRQGRLNAKQLADLRERVEASGLLEATYTQPSDPTLLTEGVMRLTLRKGKKRHELTPPRVGEATAATKALSKRISAFGGELAKLLEPHLGDPLPTGRYARAALVPPQHAKRMRPPETVTDGIAEHLAPALETEGLYVRLRDGDAIKQGARMSLRGRLVIWIVDHFEGKEK